MDSIFVLHTEQAMTFTLSVKDHARLYGRSLYFQALEDFYGRSYDQNFQGTSHLRGNTQHVTQAVTGDIQIRMSIPEFFPLNADDTAAVLIECAQPLMSLHHIAGIDFLKTLFVLDYYQLLPCACELLDQFSRSHSLAMEPTEYLCTLATIFGIEHVLTKELLASFAKRLDLQDKHVLVQMAGHSLPPVYSVRRLRRLLRGAERTLSYYTQFRQFYCTHCDANYQAKPTSRYTYDLAVVWPCCARLVHTPCFEQIVYANNCIHCNTPYFLGRPNWLDATEHSRQQMLRIRAEAGFDETDMLPNFPRIFRGENFS